MSSFQEEITAAIIDAMQEVGVLCANYHLMRDDRRVQVKEFMFSAVKKVMDINGYTKEYD